MSLAGALERTAREVVRELADAVRGGRGFDGRALAPKKRPDGKPVGGPGMASIVQGASVEVRDEGFDIRWDNEALEAFHEGNNRQPARPVIGWTAQRLGRATRRVLDAVVDEATRLGFRKRGGGR